MPAWSCCATRNRRLPVVIGIVTATSASPPRVRACRCIEIPLADFPRLQDYTGRGVITTATYAARALAGSAMGLMKAARLCPQAILLPVDFDQYRRYSRRFKQIITDIAP